LGGVVPLSEHEQRQLEQIEQALYREDRRLARLVRSSDPRVHYRRRVAEALIGLALGAAMIAVGILLSIIGLAVAGFVVMLLCGIWALNSWRQAATVAVGAAAGAGAAAPAGKRKSRRSSRRRGSASSGPRGSFGERLDERWRRRQEGDF
jgi:membrane protein implicated in regulation of membrane protease activity